MSKFTKRLHKNGINTRDNALVIETRFGHIADLTEVFDNVFLISRHPIEFKSKNLVYRSDFSDIGVIPNITNIFVDPVNFIKLNDALPVITKYRPDIIVNSEHLIERSFSKSVWQIGYRPTEVFDKLHIWKKIK